MGVFITFFIQGAWKLSLLLFSFNFHFAIIQKSNFEVKLIDNLITAIADYCILKIHCKSLAVMLIKCWNTLP